MNERTAERARRISVDLAQSADRLRGRMESWLVAGNAAAFAGLAAALLSAKIHPYILPAAMFSAWVFFFGVLAGVVSMALMGAFHHERSVYNEDLARSIEDGRPKPKMHAPAPPGGSIPPAIGVACFVIGIAVPLIYATAVALSGRMPFPTGS